MNIKFYLIIILVVLELVGSIDQKKEKDLVFENNLLDVGTVNDDTLITHVFKVKNVSEGLIQIIDTQKSCTCSSLILDKKTFQPGDVGQIIMKVNTKGKSGKFSVFGILIANTEQKYYKLMLRGNISRN